MVDKTAIIEMATRSSIRVNPLSFRINLIVTSQDARLHKRGLDFPKQFNYHKIKMFSSVKLIALVVGLAVLIVAGGFSYRYYQGRSQQPVVSNNQTITSEVADQQDKANVSLNADAILPSPPAATSGALLDKYVQEVQQVAVEGDALEITNCAGKPSSIRMKKGSRLTIKNNDSKEITIMLNANNTYTVPAKSSQAFTITAGIALYSYICSQKDRITLRNAGSMEIVK